MSTETKQEWISVEDRPLISQTKLGWEVNEGVPDEFIGALEVFDNKKNTSYWWIRHCIIIDEVGLCVMSDDDYEPCGWQISDITYWQPMPEPPNTKQ